MISKLVSVIIPSYNHSVFLDRRMESLLTQTYSNLEIIIIDDCSTENNLEILKKYLSDPRVKLISRVNNGGVSAVNNQGIELSSGEYIIFAQCDDACESQMIEQLVNSLDLNPSVGISFTRNLMIDESDKVLGNDFTIRQKAFRNRCISDTIISGSEMSRFLFHSCVIPNMSSVMFKRDCLNKIGLFSLEYKACLDWDMFFRIARNYDFYYISKPLNHFRQHSKTIRSKISRRDTYNEFFHVLLPEISKNKFSALDCFKFRFNVMYLWAVDLIKPSFIGFSNFFYHLKQVWLLDPLALILLPFAILKRLLEAPGKLVKLYSSNS